MDDSGSITHLIQRLASGGTSEWETVAAVVYQEFCDKLLRLARQKVDRHLQSRADEDDIVQSVFKSFFLRAREGRFQLCDRDDLWALLVGMTVNKAHELMAHHARQKRQMNRDQGFPGLSGDDSDLDFIECLRSLEPTAEDAMQLTEGLEQRLRSLGDPVLQKIALLKLDGFTNLEVAEQLNLKLRSVERKLDLIRREWLEFQGRQ